MPARPQIAPTEDWRQIELLARAPDQRRLQMVTPEQLFEAPHRSPQPPLWTWGEDEWRPVLRLPAYALRTSRPPAAVQPRPLRPRGDQRLSRAGSVPHASRCHA